MSKKKTKEYQIDELGSLGLLAIGYKGLRAWREKKKEIQQQKEKDGKKEK
ncbi:MAG: hypothetical protein P1U41_04750 [Vicingaceae bacterium]|nr:hypothetical protein [Vicingaceae bacterium]